MVKEALACDMPVVSVDVGDVRERLEKVEGCEVCPDDTPESIATALDRVLGSKKRVKTRNAITDLDEKNITRMVIETYERALVKRSANTKLKEKEVVLNN